MAFFHPQIPPIADGEVRAMIREYDARRGEEFRTLLLVVDAANTANEQRTLFSITIWKFTFELRRG